YETDQLVYKYKKPMVAILDGIVRGGGVGLTYGASHRLVPERAKWAMPEKHMGFCAGVGAAYFINKARGKAGLYLALTVSVISADDVLYLNAADTCCSSKHLPGLLQVIEDTNWQDVSVDETLTRLLAEYSKDTPQKGHIEQSQD